MLRNLTQKMTKMAPSLVIFHIELVDKEYLSDWTMHPDYHHTIVPSRNEAINMFMNCEPKSKEENSKDDSNHYIYQAMHSKVHPPLTKKNSKFWISYTPKYLMV